jgi:hypothetical protein
MAAWEARALYDPQPAHMTNARNPLLEKLDPADEAAMRSLIGGAIRTQAVYVAAKLAIADQLSLGARDADEIAQRVQADAATLKRLLRFLVFHGVFAENEDGRFALNGAAEFLQTAHPRSLRPSAIRAGEGMWQVSARLLDAVQTGRTPYDDVHGMPYFERIAERGRDNVFASRMSSSTAGLGEALARLDCVKRARTIVDVGGGHGAVLVELLRRHPHLRGVLLDREPTIEGARTFIEHSGMRERCELVPGDFFDGVPKGGDVYLLSWILHDWNDEAATRILRACREAGGDDVTLLIVEVLLPPRAVAGEGNEHRVIADPYTLDLQMLLLTGGSERTADEYRDLLREAGFEVKETTGFTSARGASAIEAHAERSGRGCSRQGRRETE